MVSRLRLPKERKFEGPAPAWRRLVAFAIDLLILDFVVVFPFRRVFGKLIPDATSVSSMYAYLSSDSSINAWITTITVLMGLFFIAYFAMLEGRLGQSIGKMVMKIYVKSVQKKTSWWQHIVRGLFLLPVFPFILLWILDPLFMFFSASHQRLSEILSRTKTVHSYPMV